jgi:hypothetical protein
MSTGRYLDTSPRPNPFREYTDRIMDKHHQDTPKSADSSSKNDSDFKITVRTSNSSKKSKTKKNK